MRVVDFYESDFGTIINVDKSPMPGDMAKKPSYTTERKKYLEWKRNEPKRVQYEKALGLMLGWIREQGGNLNEYEWRECWLQKKGAE